MSHHNDSIAVGSWSGDIIILDAITGSQSAVLSGHIGGVACVVFSSDGTSLVSGSEDRTVKLWDIQTGGVAKTFLGHRGAVWCVSISADSATIASGSNDAKIFLWSIQTGECYHTIEQQNVIRHLKFSPKVPQHLISVSGEKIWQWDAYGFQIRPPFDGENVAFSSNGSQFVSCFERTITLHNSSSGAIVTQFQMFGGYISALCFSPNDSILAISGSKVAYCWDITTSEPQLVDTFIGHDDYIMSLTFSSSTTLVSASSDGSVKFWQIGTQSTIGAPSTIGAQSMDPPKYPHVEYFKYVTLQSKEGVAIYYSDGLVQVWDISTGICSTASQVPHNYEVGDVQLVSGRLIFVWYSDEKIHAWDAESRELLWEVDAPWDNIEILRISADGSSIFGLYNPSILAWSLQTGEVVGKSEIEYNHDSGFSIGSGSKDWGCWPQSHQIMCGPLTHIELFNISICSSPTKLWDPKQANIKNPATGEVIFQLSRRFAKPLCVQCDDSYLFAGYQSGEILILDLTNVK